MSQELDTLKALKFGVRMTSLDALRRLGIISFPKRISALRKLGYRIEQRPIKLNNGKRVNEYWMESTI